MATNRRWYQIQCEKCLARTGDRLEPTPEDPQGRPVELYQCNEGGAIRCEACVDGEVEIERPRV